MWLLRTTTSLRPPVHPCVHIPARPTLHILGAQAKAAQDMGAERGRCWHHSPPPQGRDDPAQPHPHPPHLLPILASSAGPGSPGRTIPSHAGLQGGTSSFVYLTASLTNSHYHLASHQSVRSPTSLGSGRELPGVHRVCLCLHTRACVCMHVRACMCMQAAQINKRATGAAAALGSELPRHMQVKQALRSVLLMVPLVPPFVLVHITVCRCTVPTHTLPAWRQLSRQCPRAGWARRWAAL